MDPVTQICRIVLTVVSCTMDPATPRPSPAEAAAILRASVPPAVAEWRLEGLYPPSLLGAYEGGTYLPPPPHDAAWPFSGTFAPTWAPSLTRLDGSSVFQPPTVYGVPNFYHADPGVLLTGGYDRATNTYYPAGAFQHYGGYRPRAHTPGRWASSTGRTATVSTPTVSAPTASTPTVRTVGAGIGRPASGVGRRR